MTNEKKPEENPGVEIAYYYTGLRLSADDEMAATFEIVNKNEAPSRGDETLVFTVPTKRIAGAQIGVAYLMTHKGGTKWSFPVGDSWYKKRVDGKLAREVDRATWEVQDKAAKQEKAAMKWKAHEGFERAIAPLATIYWRLSAVERVTFETMILRKLRKSI